MEKLNISDFEGYTENEKIAYQMIKNVRENSYIMYEINKQEYINEMNNNPAEAFANIYHKRLNRFDEEMADATLEAFKTVDNANKVSFPAYFKGVWKYYN